MRKTILLFILPLFLVHVVNAQNKSNKGKEFWVGYGHNQLTTEVFVLYLSAEQPANVTVTIPSIGWIRTYNIPANTAISTDQIPNTVRLNTEGVSSSGIHVESDVDIVAYAHQYGGSSSGATMLMPVETYGYTYYSLNYVQQTNATPAYSWFFVVASEDNTRLQITPSVTTQGGRPANQTFTVNLNKGQVYNVFGQTSGLSGNDVSGSKIVSVADAQGVCHPIGVFSGASRMTICNSSSGEFMMQQIFPASAWGTKYLTYPTVSTNNVASPNINFYRIAVRDPSTVVKRNGVVLTGLINNFYYDIFSNTGEFIEADKPILVEQLTPSTSSPCFVSGYPSYNGQGDPEMFYLSPLEQSVKKAVFFTTSNAAITNTYVCAIMPVSSYNTFKIDGATNFDYVVSHPQNIGYRVVIKRWNQSGGEQHIIESDSTFTAMVYGFGNVESYGYNAGTMVNNLNALGGVQNTFGTSASGITCPNSPFKFSIQVAYKPTQMIWKLSQVGSNLQPVNADTTLTNPTPLDSAIVNGRKYYTYRLPREYFFTDTGTYSIPISCTAPEIDNCNNTEDLTYTVRVNPGPKGDFSFTYSGCVTDTAYFTGSVLPGQSYVVNKYRWYYDDGTQDTVQNPRKKFNTQGPHPTKFRVIATDGCVGDTIKVVTTTTSPTANFGFTPSSACGSATVNFTDSSTFAGSPLNNYYWDFGNGNTLLTNNNQPQTQQYNSPGSYIIKHHAGVASGCGSDTVYKTLHIYAFPNVYFDFNTGCLQDSTVNFTDQTTTSDNQQLTWQWNFGEPSSGVNNVSTIQNPAHRYSNYGTYPVKLKVTTVNGCTDSLTRNYTIGGFAPPVKYTIVNKDSLCSYNAVTLINQMNVVQDSIYKIDVYWDFANSPAFSQSYINPTANQQFTYFYGSFTSPATKNITLKWVSYSKGGCVSEKTEVITLHAIPTLAFANLTGVCVNSTAISIANASVTNSLSGNGIYSGNGTIASGTFTPQNANLGINTIKYVYTTNVGCKDSITQTINVFPKPIAGFRFSGNICAVDSVLLTDTSSISSGTIKERHWSYGDNTNDIKTNAIPFYKKYATHNSYTVKLSVISDSACVSDTAVRTVIVHPMPVVDFQLPSGVCMPGGEARFINNSTIPNGNVSSMSYSWNFGQNSFTTPVVNPTYNYTAFGPFTVRLRATSLQGCVDSASKVLSAFYDKPTANFVVLSDTLCPNKNIRFSDSSTVANTTISEWIWAFSNGDSAFIQHPIKAFTQPNTYTAILVVKTPDGCTSTPFARNFTIYKQPVVDAGQLQYTPEGLPVIINASINDATAFTYRWTPAIYLNNATILNPIVRPIFTTTYTIKASGPGNCYDTDSVKIVAFKKLVIPNAFSPNGDRVNDFWDIPFLNDYPNCVIELYTRNGQRVYRSVGYNGPWDGTNNGIPVPIGTYYYIIDVNNNGYTQLTGSITIIR